MSESLNGDHVVAAGISGIVISTVAVVLRMWSRLVSVENRVWWDDYFSLAAWVLSVANCSMSVYWGRMIELQQQDTAKLSLPLFIGDFTYNAGITLVKLSILCFYARIFHIVRGFRIVLWITTLLVISWWIAFTIVSAAGCSPAKKDIDPTTPGHCIDGYSFFIATATSNVAIDLIILVMPLPMIWPLEMSSVRRLALVLLFMSGYSVVIVSILRMVSTIRYDTTHSSHHTNSAIEVETLFAIEIPIGVLSICLPMILQLGRKIYEDGWEFSFRTRPHGNISKGLPGSGSDMSQDTPSQADRGHSTITETKV